MDDEATTVRRHARTPLFGEHPTGADRFTFDVLFFIPECPPDLADLTDQELREALQTTMLRTLRSVPTPGTSRATAAPRTRPGRPPE